MEKAHSLPYYFERLKKSTMMKKMMNKISLKKGLLSSTLIVAGIVVASLASCKGQGPCDAYPGAKGTRSFNSTHHHKHH